jgi:hypothetical protein
VARRGKRKPFPGARLALRSGAQARRAGRQWWNPAESARRKPHEPPVYPRQLSELRPRFTFLEAAASFRTRRTREPRSGYNPGRSRIGENPTTLPVNRGKKASPGSAPPAGGGPSAPLPGIDDDRRTAGASRTPGRVSRSLPVSAAHRHGTLVTQPRIVPSPGSALGAPPLGYSSCLPPSLSAPAVGPTLLGCHSPHPSCASPPTASKNFLAG